MVKVVLLGAGSLGYHLTQKMLSSSSVDLIQVYNRTIEKISYLSDKIAITDNLNKLKQADIYVLCVSDNAISELSSHLNFPSKLVLHTSGGTSINNLTSNSAKGVLYFPHTFSKDKKVNFNELPICLEASSNESLTVLKKFSKEFSRE